MDERALKMILAAKQLEIDITGIKYYLNIIRLFN